jgi:hypothetical protein
MAAPFQGLPLALTATNGLVTGKGERMDNFSGALAGQPPGGRLIDCPRDCGYAAPGGLVGKPHDSPRTGGRCVFLLFIGKTFLPEHVHEGYVNYSSTVEHFVPVGPVHLIDEALTALADHGTTEYSSSEWQRYGWYTDPDRSQLVDDSTGERVETSAHLWGFTEPESLELWERVKQL